MKKKKVQVKMKAKMQLSRNHPANKAWEGGRSDFRTHTVTVKRTRQPHFHHCPFIVAIVFMIAIIFHCVCKV
jgi:hypothetical protein